MGGGKGQDARKGKLKSGIRKRKRKGEEKRTGEKRVRKGRWGERAEGRKLNLPQPGKGRGTVRGSLIDTFIGACFFNGIVIVKRFVSVINGYICL